LNYDFLSKDLMTSTQDTSETVPEMSFDRPFRMYHASHSVPLRPWSFLLSHNFESTISNLTLLTIYNNARK
jgi:hypothetical protein